jgi:serine/threonine protein kinase
VALKVLAPELSEEKGFRERFIRESRLAASIDHPNIIPIYDAGEQSGLLYIAMRYVERANSRPTVDTLMDFMGSPDADAPCRDTPRKQGSQCPAITPGR